MTFERTGPEFLKIPFGAKNPIIDNCYRGRKVYSCSYCQSLPLGFHSTAPADPIRDSLRKVWSTLKSLVPRQNHTIYGSRGGPILPFPSRSRIVVYGPARSGLSGQSGTHDARRFGIEVLATAYFLAARLDGAFLVQRRAKRRIGSSIAPLIEQLQTMV